MDFVVVLVVQKAILEDARVEQYEKRKMENKAKGVSSKKEESEGSCAHNRE
ncbi:acyl-CoA synthetase family member 4 isoform X1 [Sesbania bispinosa]|nr:acyl-CoA synthetase family member 4 isoform X1 [Sesbania bispinosa]